MRHDTLSDMFSILKNAENAGKKECVVPASKLVESVLQVIKSLGYIEDFETDTDVRSRGFKVKMMGKINNCNAIKPRFPVKNDEFNKWEKRYLPGVGFGAIIVTTSKGVISHEKAVKMKLGGAILGFIY